MMEELRRCQTWLPRKGRTCSASALPNVSYCGNHKPPDVETRVPCPIDPSHHILKTEVDAHTKRCPTFLRIQELESMPYYVQGVNAGSDDDEDDYDYDHDTDEADSKGDDGIIMLEHKGIKQACSRDGMYSELGGTIRGKAFGEDVENRRLQGYWTSNAKRSCFNSLPKEELERLVVKIELAYHTHCKDKFDFAFEQPSACSKWIDAKSGLDRRVPFQEKHAMQQASMLGNMEKFGLLPQPNDVDKGKGFSQFKGEPVFIEFGAGRGYLTHMLADCYDAKKLIFIDRRPYKFKADRTLRQNADVSFERILIDIEHLNLSGIQSLRGSHYIALSKHLCGNATDLTLRCCLGPKSDLLSQGSVPLFDGLAIATCCHHLCQWKSYVNKDFFRKMDFSKQDFHVITWFTSGALSYDRNGLSDEHTQINHLSNQGELLYDLTSIQSRKFQAGLEDINEFFSQPANRVTLGLKCKQLLDIGRLNWLSHHGMNAQLVSYVPSSITPENKLLLARSMVQ